MFNHFRLIPFIFGLVLGFVGIYLLKPLDKIVFRYPSPSNVEKTIYKDKNGICYSYISEKVDCDKNEGSLKDYPLQ